MRERERRRRWIVACRLESWNVTRHARICSSHFEGGPGPTKTNPIPTLFAFPKQSPAKSNNISRWSWGQSPTVCTDANISPYPRDKNSRKELRISTGGCCRRTNPRNVLCKWDTKTQSYSKLFWTSRSTSVCGNSGVQTDLTGEDIEVMTEAKVVQSNWASKAREVFHLVTPSVGCFQLIVIHARLQCQVRVPRRCKYFF